MFDRERKVQWIVVLRRTDSEGKYGERNFRFFSGPGHFTGSTYLPKRFVCEFKTEVARGTE